MRGLAEEIKEALDNIIEGLNYDLFSGEAEEETILDQDKMQKIMQSKVSSFNSAKKILNKWISSPNRPSDAVIKKYIKEILSSGDNAIKTLRKALKSKIYYAQLDAHKHDAAIKSKTFILEAIFDIDNAIGELRIKLDNGNFDLSDREYKLGYPERFAKGEFFPRENYWKDWYNKKEDAVKICPFSTEGEIIELEGLKVQLPKVPKDKTTILFHDLPKKEQYWKRQAVPTNITPENVEQWHGVIVEEFRRRREGIWFMNNGEPVYLTGNAYFALQHCIMLDDGDYMGFRYAQLNVMYHMEACIIDNRSLGQIFLKSRRTGFTYISLFIMLNNATFVKNQKFGMMSKSQDDVEEMWQKLSYAYMNLPFYFRPVVRGKEDSLTELFFGSPTENTKEAKKARTINVKDYLNTQIDWRPTKNDSYDSVKLNWYIGDEAFKIWRNCNYITHLGMLRPTMQPAGKIVGKAFIGSTMGAHSRGGDAGIELINGSLIENRNPITGKTATSLYFYFLPAQDNMPQFTDKYGRCWTEKPPTKTLNIYNDEITIGSIEYLMAEEEEAKKQSDAAYNEQLRTYPRRKEDAMRDETGQCAFNMTKITEQLEFNDKTKASTKYVVGNFDWEDGIIDGNVKFFPDKYGRFKVSWMPSDLDGTAHLRNRVKEINRQFYPLNDDNIRFGCDPFSVGGTKRGGSSGGMHGKTLVNPEDQNVPKHKFVVEYLARPNDETIFFEDVIKCIRFYGAPILVESNRVDLLRHMRNRGYRHFAMNRVDKVVLSESEERYGGQPMSGVDILESHKNIIGAYVQQQVGLSTDEKYRPLGEMGEFPFDETLNDWLRFDPANRTAFDATISSGMCLMACNKEKYKPKVEKPKREVKGFFKKYKVSTA